MPLGIQFLDTILDTEFQYFILPTRQGISGFSENSPVPFLEQPHTLYHLHILEANSGIYTAPRPPPLPNSKVPPKPGETTRPSQPQKFCYVSEVYKMTKVLEDGRKMDKNAIFH